MAHVYNICKSNWLKCQLKSTRMQCPSVLFQFMWIIVHIYLCMCESIHEEERRTKYLRGFHLWGIVLWPLSPSLSIFQHILHVFSSFISTLKLHPFSPLLFSFTSSSLKTHPSCTVQLFLYYIYITSIYVDYMCV